MMEAIGAVGCMLIGLTVWIWAHVLPLFLNDKFTIVMLVTLVWYGFVYFRYRNRIDTLTKKYKDCRLNKYIHDFALWLFVPLSFVVGIGVPLLILRFLN